MELHFASSEGYEQGKVSGKRLNLTSYFEMKNKEKTF